MMRYPIAVFACVLLLPLSFLHAKEPDQKSKTVSLEDAITRALSDSPRVKVSGSALMASKGERRQAGLLPNPELSIEAANVGGSRSYKGLDSAEITYGASQLIEIGGKRSARIAAAKSGVEIASYEQSATRLDLVRDVTVAYAEAVAAKEDVKLAEEQKKLASEVLQNVSQRVDAAREPLIQKSKAQVTLSTSEIALDKAIRQAAIAKKKLASLWGHESEIYELNGAGFFTIKTPDPLPELTQLAKTPDFARWDAEVSRAKASFDLEKSNAIPDPRLSAGVRDFRDTGDQAFVVGISLPIPVLNRNQGSIERARHEISRTESNKQQTALTLSNELTQNYEELQIAYNQANALKKTILPAAEKAFSLARQGYGIGKLPYLEVLDAERTLADVRSGYNTALKDYHTRRAEVERLTAAHMKTLEEKGDQHE